MKPAQLRAILALPFNVLVVVPALILAFTGSFAPAGPRDPAFWLALACLGGYKAAVPRWIPRWRAWEG